MKGFGHFHQKDTSNLFLNSDQNKQYRILIVDDEDAIGRLLRSILSRLGHEVEFCQTLADARNMVASFSPHVVVMDINLPDGNGLDEAHSLKKTYPDLQIIMISALDFANAVTDDPDMVTFVRKPFNRERIVQAIQMTH